MTDALDKIKPRVRELKAYTLSPDRASIKLNQNENPFDLPLRIQEETLRRMKSRSWSRYPDFIPLSLHEKLAAFSNWKTDGIVAGNGSNELIQATLMVAVTEGKKVLISEPTFALYRQVATVLGSEIVSVPLNENFSFDVAALKDAVEKKQPDVVILCSPNNPTGCTIDIDDLKSLLEISRGLFVIDEAYWEFSEKNFLPLLSSYKNLILFRTFSKAMGLAALRVGFLLAAPEIAREISKAVLPYNLNAFSQTAAEVSVEFYNEELKPFIEKIIEERGRLFGAIQNINGLTPVKTEANFFIVRSEIEPKKVFHELLQRDILIRDVSGYPMLKDYFRVSVGTPQENDALVKALSDFEF